MALRSFQMSSRMTSGGASPGQDGDDGGEEEEKEEEEGKIMMMSLKMILMVMEEGSIPGLASYSSTSLYISHFHTWS